MTLAYAEAKNAAATGRNYRLTDSAGLHLYVTKAGAKPLQVQSSGPDDQTTERSGRRATAVQSCAVGALLTGSAATAGTGPSAKPAKSGKRTDIFMDQPATFSSIRLSASNMAGASVRASQSGLMSAKRTTRS